MNSPSVRPISTSPSALPRPSREALRSAESERPVDWRALYARRLAVSDTITLVVVVLTVQLFWFGLDPASVTIDDRFRFVAIGYTTLSVLITAVWALMLGIEGSRGYRVLGAGPQEYRLVLNATARTFGLLAVVAFLFKIEFARGYILLALPLGLLALLVTRWIWRRSINQHRRSGQFMSRVILVGSPDSAEAIAREFARMPQAGYLVVGYASPSGRDDELTEFPDIPTVDLDRLPTAMFEVAADTVVITNGQDLTPERVRRISWALEPGRQHLVVSPGLTDVGGPRIHTRPVAGLPLMHVETPRYEGANRFSKRAFDLVVAVALLVALTPLLIVVAILVRATSPGPVLFRQRRVGHNGHEFDMLKFRSMVVDAEERLEELRAQQEDAGNEVLFKLRDDPRITRVGRFMRRYSIDELPQLLNVVLGTMSLVGPRPPLPSEVATYQNHVHRRFLVKPGITGLWQVSGRSNLSWSDTVRLDLSYVDNWSPTSDLMILWRTARAVVGRDGAY